MLRERLSLEYVIISLLVVSLAGAVWYGLRLRAAGSESWLTVIDIFSSIVLSFILVAVYILQNKILQRQSRVMSGGHVPAIAVLDVDFNERAINEFRNPPKSQGSVSSIKVKVLNKGNDVATNIAVVSFLHHDKLAFGRRWALANAFLQKVPFVRRFVDTPHFTPRRILLESTDLSTEIRQTSGPVLPANMDDPIELYGALGVNYHPSENYATIPDAVDILADHDIDQAYLGFSLVYTNTFGEVYELPLKTFQLSRIEEGVPIDDLMEGANPYSARRLHTERYFEPPAAGD